VIRAAEPGDLEAVVCINNQATKWVGRKDRGFFETYLGLPFFRVLESGGAVEGFLLAMGPEVEYDSRNFLWFRERFESFCYIDRVVVDEALQRSGRGTLLYNDLIGRRGAVPLACEVCIDPLNAESVAFHETFGFRETGVHKLGGKTLRMYLLR